MSVPFRTRERWWLALLALPMAACVAPAGEVPDDDLERDADSLLGTATYAGCSPEHVRVLEHAHHLGRVASLSRAFESCLDVAMTGQVPWGNVLVGPVAQCPDVPIGVGELRLRARSPRPLAITCDAAANNWGYAGSITNGTETFSLGATALGSAASESPNMPEIATTYWHEVMHDTGLPHCDPTPNGEGPMPGGAIDAVWAVDACIGGALRAAAEVCGREDQNACPGGLMMPERLSPDGSWSAECECVVDNQPRPSVRPEIPRASAVAVQRSIDAAHVFSAAHDGVVTMSSWGDDGSSMWGSWRRADDIAAPLLPDGAVVTGLAMDTHRLDLFAVDVLGRITSAYWLESTAAWSDWYVISAEIAPPGAPVAAISRHANHLDVFVVGSDGAIHEAWWNQGLDAGAWHWAAPITDAGLVQPGNELAVTARYPDVVDVFFASLDGAVSNVFWAGGSFSAPVAVIAPGSVRADAHVAALARGHEALDVLAPGAWGDVRHARWTSTTGGWVETYDVAGPGQAEPSGSIAVYSRVRDHLDAYWVALDGRVAGAWSAGGGAWSAPYTMIAEPVAADATLAVITRYAQHVDVLAADRFAAGTRVPAIHGASWDVLTDHAWDDRVDLVRLDVIPVRAPRSATARAVSATQIELSFRDEEGTALRYEIRAPGLAGMLGAPIVGDIVPLGDTSTRSVLVESLAPATSYSFRVCTADGDERECLRAVTATTLSYF